MCDIMMVGLSIDIASTPEGAIEAARTEIWHMIHSGGLGTWVERGTPRSQQSRGSKIRKAIMSPTSAGIEAARLEAARFYERNIKERLAAAVGGSPEHSFVFALTAGPGVGCICDATWNNYSPPVPNPEKAPIVSFLRRLLSLRYVRTASFYYGSIEAPEPPEEVWQWPIETESASTFIEHFYTEEPGKIIGNGASGFFLVRPQ